MQLYCILLALHPAREQKQTASHLGGCLLKPIKLHAEQGEYGVAESKQSADDARHGQRNKGTEAEPQEEQPHAPTRNVLGQIHFHLTLSLGVEGLALSIQTAFVLLNPNLDLELRW
jgi:hypothetical protein